MTNIFKKAMEAYQLQHFFGKKVAANRETKEDVRSAHVEQMLERYQGMKLNDEQKALCEKFRQGLLGFTQFRVEMDKLISKEVKKNIEMLKPIGDSRDRRYNDPKGAPKASYEQVRETIEATEIYNRAKELILKAQRKQVAYGLDKYPEPLNADTWSLVETIDHILDESIDKTHYLVMLRIKLEERASVEAESMRREAELYKLGEFILNEFPDEIGLGNPEEGESAVDVAIRLLAQDKYQYEYKEHLDGQVYVDGQLVAGKKPSLKELREALEICEPGQVYTDADTPKPSKVYVDGRLLSDNGFIDLAKSGADLDGDIVHVDSLSEYCKADVEATHKFISGITSDEEYTHEYSTYVNNKAKFNIVTQPDHESDTQEVSINFTLDRDADFDTLNRTLFNELQKMKERGLIK